MSGKRKAKAAPTDRQMLDRLARAANAVIKSGVIKPQSGRPWPTRYTAPCKPLHRLAEVINEIGKAR